MSADDQSLDLEDMAYHAAGHAIAVLYFREQLLSFTVGPKLHQVEWRCAGTECACQHSRDSHLDIHAMIKIAGSVAGSILSGRTSLKEAEKEASPLDWESARQLARSRCLDKKEADAYLKWLERRVRVILIRNWQSVTVLADHAIWQVARGNPEWRAVEKTVIGIAGARMAPPWEAAEGQ